MTQANESAFPSKEERHYGQGCVAVSIVDGSAMEDRTGLTKREYFAGLIMQGMHASRDGGFQKIDYDWFSLESVRFADALIEELNKK